VSSNQDGRLEFGKGDLEGKRRREGGREGGRKGGSEDIPIRAMMDAVNVSERVFVELVSHALTSHS